MNSYNPYSLDNAAILKYNKYFKSLSEKQQKIIKRKYDKDVQAYGKEFYGIR